MITKELPVQQAAPVRRLQWFVWLPSLLLAACIARLWIEPLTSSFWVDEMVTAFVIQHPGHPSFAVAPQVPASIYYWLPAFSLRLFGTSELAYRIPSILAMGFALFLIGRLAARLIHPQATWFAVFACLGLRGLNYHAADARPYALGIMVASAALFFLIRWLDEKRWADAALFVFFAALLWRVHLIYWPFYLVFGFYVLMRIRTGQTRVTGRQVMVVFSAIALLLIPVGIEAFTVLRGAGQHVIIAIPTFREFEHEIRWSLVVVCGGSAWLLGRMFGWSTEPQYLLRTSLGLIAAWWLGQCICLYLFSHITGNSVFVDRYLSLGLPGIGLAATAAVALWLPAAHWRTASVAVGIGVLIVMGRWGNPSFRHDRSDWRSAAATENQFALSADTPVICPSPFIEARLPVWDPAYPLPGFLYAHLSFYPLKGRAYLFPFETADGELYAARLTRETLKPSRRFMIYGSEKSVKYWRVWLSGMPEMKGWKSSLKVFGDVALAVFDAPRPQSG
jgi:hypothetical protein